MDWQQVVESEYNANHYLYYYLIRTTFVFLHQLGQGKDVEAHEDVDEVEHRQGHHEVVEGTA